MSDKYVSALWGDDINSGDDAANAKATISAGLVASTNDSTIFVYPGVYNESVTSSNKIISFQAIGKVILDGQSSLLNGFNGKNRAWLVNNFEIKNYILYGIQCTSGGGDAIITNNIIHNVYAGIFISLVPVTAIKNNTIYNCRDGMYLNGGSISFQITNNTFDSCQYAIRMNAGTVLNNSKSTRITNNIFSNNEAALFHIDNVDIWLSALLESDGNMFDIPGGGVLAKYSNGAGTLTDLAAWQSTMGFDNNSLEADPQYANATLGIYSVLPGSPAESGSLEGGYVGARFTEFGWYDQAALQSGAIFDDTQYVALSAISGIKLSGVATSGILELAPLNMESGVSLVNILDIFSESFNNSIIDLDISDNASPNGELQIEIKAANSLAALSGASYQTYNLRDDIPTSGVSGQYIQARLTLNR